MRILVFGDSIAYGAWDSQGGWVDRLKKDCHARGIESKGTNKLQVINLGIGGDSSTKILARIESEIESRYSKNWPFIIVLSFGTNDERSTNGTHETSLEDFEHNTRKILTICEKYSEKIVFVGTFPFAEDTISFKGSVYSNKPRLEYEQVIKDVSRDRNIHYVPLIDKFSNKDPDLYSFDSLHPSDKGHELIYKEAMKKINELTGK